MPTSQLPRRLAAAVSLSGCRSCYRWLYIVLYLVRFYQRMYNSTGASSFPNWLYTSITRRDRSMCGRMLSREYCTLTVQYRADVRAPPSSAFSIAAGGKHHHHARDQRASSKTRERVQREIRIQENCQRFNRQNTVRTYSTYKENRTALLCMYVEIGGDKGAGRLFNAYLYYVLPIAASGTGNNGSPFLREEKNSEREKRKADARRHGGGIRKRVN